MSDQNVGYAIPPITNTAIIIANIIVFLYELAVPRAQLESFFMQWGAVPANISQFQHLPTLVTAMFLHGGWLHIIGNMAMLKLLGDNVEDAMGHWSYLFFYLLSGLGAGALQVLIDPTSTIPMVGASGAIAGVMGAYLVLFPQGMIRLSLGQGMTARVLSIPAYGLIVFWFLQQLFNGFASLGADASTGGGVAFWAHVGGFITGAALVWLFKDQESVDRQRAAMAAEKTLPAGAHRVPPPPPARPPAAKSKRRRPF
ncbi:MAG: rhomboid family intramembrane serine protease [Thermomicrobiales bacterium]